MEPLTYEEIQRIVLDLGWDDMGITDPLIPSEDIHAYRQWLENDNHASLAYMENQIRCAPQELLPGAQSVVMLISYYKQAPLPFEKGKGLIASYARGRDYHNVHRRRLKKLIGWLESRAEKKGVAKGFSDSTPILEKALAVQAGLGWFGKNTLLIHRRFGTFTLLSGLLTTLKLPHSPKPQEQHAMRCGVCDRCLQACPTQALTSPYHLDASRCLSYQLIESKDPVPGTLMQHNPGYLFGCDICQDVCPHNAKKAPSTTPDFQSSSGLGAYLTLAQTEVLQNTPEKLHGTPLKRKGATGLHTNNQQLETHH